MNKKSPMLKSERNTLIQLIYKPVIMRDSTYRDQSSAIKSGIKSHQTLLNIKM